MKVLAGNRALNYNHLGVKAAQDWTTHHVVFNSLEHNEANLYLGCWGGASASLWFDDAGPNQIRAWLESAKDVNGVFGVLYTTWQNKYDDLEQFSARTAGN